MGCRSLNLLPRILLFYCYLAHAVLDGLQIAESAAAHPQPKAVSTLITSDLISGWRARRPSGYVEHLNGPAESFRHEIAECRGIHGALDFRMDLAVNEDFIGLRPLA